MAWFVLPLLLAGTSGCIVIPLPHYERAINDSRQSVAEPAANVMKSPAATRADVLFWLGEPDLIWDDGRVIVYRWTTSKVTIFYAAGAGYQGDAGISECPISNFILFEFDPTGRVRRWEQRKAPVMVEGDEYTRRIWRNW